MKTLDIHTRQEWRDWLEKNFDKEDEIWLLYPKKESGKPKIIYNDAVEEALCFGAINVFEWDLLMKRGIVPKNSRKEWKILSRKQKTANNLDLEGLRSFFNVLIALGNS